MIKITKNFLQQANRWELFPLVGKTPWVYPTRKAVSEHLSLLRKMYSEWVHPIACHLLFLLLCLLLHCAGSVCPRLTQEAASCRKIHSAVLIWNDLWDPQHLSTPSVLRSQKHRMSKNTVFLWWVSDLL